jgi:hypothetical protein
VTVSDHLSAGAPTPTTEMQAQQASPLASGPGWTALSERSDLAKYGSGNSIGLFAAELRLGIDDIDTFAADALTDATNDKNATLSP